MNTLLAEFTELDKEAAQYVRELHQDPHLRGFIFVHDGRDEAHLYEGVTFSFGHCCPKQDRLSLVTR